MPRNSDWVQASGYLFIHCGGKDKQGCVATGVRNDIAKKHYIGPLEDLQRRVIIAIRERQGA